ncbi:DUF2177 family protein [Halovulum dunhuangense]|uniref:DUF2177 family protein n=1 Tax=Halovulum dunhuangense TaxID=1505036 RepID=A0A849L0G4_9RHOB|nr:DUF2177 family protein [Halovulum dunhuangense]NNU79757.1 DUF2177 family protein [Halovulum dunhuangense]
MAYVGTYLVGLLVFLAIDAVWLTNVMRPLFERHVGAMLRPDVNYAAAAGFYLLYIVGVLYFCSLPGLREGAVELAFLNGALLGFLAFGTYEFTNMSTLKGWSWSIVAIDTGWGMTLTGVTAVAAMLAGRWLGLGAAG